MLEFENSPEMLALKDVLREFFSGIIENAVGAFRGFGEWINDLRLNMPPLLKLFGNTKVNLFILIAFIVFVVFLNLKAYVLFAADKNKVVYDVFYKIDIHFVAASAIYTFQKINK